MRKHSVPMLLNVSTWRMSILSPRMKSSRNSAPRHSRVYTQEIVRSFPVESSPCTECRVQQRISMMTPFGRAGEEFLSEGLRIRAPMHTPLAEKQAPPSRLPSGLRCAMAGRWTWPWKSLVIRQSTKRSALLSALDRLSLRSTHIRDVISVIPAFLFAFAVGADGGPPFDGW